MINQGKNIVHGKLTFNQEIQVKIDLKIIQKQHKFSLNFLVIYRNGQSDDLLSRRRERDSK